MLALDLNHEGVKLSIKGHQLRGATELRSRWLQGPMMSLQKIPVPDGERARGRPCNILVVQPNGQTCSSRERAKDPGQGDAITVIIITLTAINVNTACSFIQMHQLSGHLSISFDVLINK